MKHDMGPMESVTPRPPAPGELEPIVAPMKRVCRVCGWSYIIGSAPAEAPDCIDIARAEASAVSIAANDAAAAAQRKEHERRLVEAS